MSDSDQQGYDELIKKHYDSVAAANGASPSSTMADHYIRLKETELILDAVARHQESYPSLQGIVDVGCGNGYTLSVLAEHFQDCALTGLEYTDSLRAIASERFAGKAVKILPGDIRDSGTLPQRQFDILICQRVIINLLDPADQKKAFSNIVGMVKKQGLLLFFECFKSSMNNLNEARNELGLETIPPAHHNLYLDDGFFSHADLKQLHYAEPNVLSTHYYASRVLYPLLIDVNKAEFRRNSHCMLFFSQALPEAVGDFAPLKFLSFQKI